MFAVENTKRIYRTGRRQRRGAMIVLAAVTFVILIAAAAFSLDVAYMHMVRAELRTATDAAARAGAETLTRTQDDALAIQAAVQAGQRNFVAGKPLNLSAGDIQLGQMSQKPGGGFNFVKGGSTLSAVQVFGRRTSGSNDGPVPLFFGPFFGTTNFQPSQQASAAASVRDIALILDRSGSMASVENRISRIDALKDAVAVFFDEIRRTSPNAKCSLVTYSTRATRDIELNTDFQTTQDRVDRLTPAGFTNIFQALRFGSDSLEANTRRKFAERTIVLMTDGNFNEGGDPTPSARVAASRGHTIHTVTFSSGANQAIMKSVAQVGNGIHIHADNAAGLKRAFKEIAQTFSVLLIE